MTQWYEVDGELLSLGESVRYKANKKVVDESLREEGFVVDNGMCYRDGRINKINYHEEIKRRKIV